MDLIRLNAERSGSSMSSTSGISSQLPCAHGSSETSQMVGKAGVPLLCVFAIATVAALGGAFLCAVSLLLTRNRWKKRPELQEILGETQTLDEELRGHHGGEIYQNDISLTDIKLQYILGKGEFGTVYKGLFRGDAVAVKMIDHEDGSPMQSGELLEVILSKRVEHHNVVKTFGHYRGRQNSIEEALSSPSAPRDKINRSDVDIFSSIEMSLQRRNVDCNTYKTLIVMEFCDKGSLHSAIKKGLFFHGKDKEEPSYGEILLTALDIAQALKYLHDQRIIHGDLKARNVLLMSDSTDERGFHCKIGDFGFSRVNTNNASIETFTCGTVRYMPPELLKDGLLTAAADVYSFGMLLWELISGVKPYPRLSNEDIIVDVVGGRRPSIPQQCPQDIASLIQDCWHCDHVLRPSFKQIVDLLSSLRPRCALSPSFQGDALLTGETAQLKELNPSNSVGKHLHDYTEVQLLAPEVTDPHTVDLSVKACAGWRSMQLVCRADGGHDLVVPMPLWERYVTEHGDVQRQSASLELLKGVTGTTPTHRSCSDSKAAHANKEGLERNRSASALYVWQETKETVRGTQTSARVATSAIELQTKGPGIVKGIASMSWPSLRLEAQHTS